MECTFKFENVFVLDCLSRLFGDLIKVPNEWKNVLHNESKFKLRNLWYNVSIYVGPNYCLPDYENLAILSSDYCYDNFIKIWFDCLYGETFGFFYEYCSFIRYISDLYYLWRVSGKIQKVSNVSIYVELNFYQNNKHDCLQVLSSDYCYENFLKKYV